MRVIIKLGMLQTVRNIFDNTTTGSIFLMIGLILSMISFFAIYVFNHNTTNCLIDSLVDTNSTTIVQSIKDNLAKCGTDANSDFSYTICSILGIFFTTESDLVFIQKSIRKHSDNLSKAEMLTEKLKNGSLTTPEAEELKIILEREGPTLGNVIGGIAIGILITLVVAYLKDKYK